MEKPLTQGWSATRESMKDSRHKLLLVAACATVLVTGAIILWPADTFGKCMVRMADKARGNATIFSQLVHSNCYAMSPSYLEQK